VLENAVAWCEEKKIFDRYNEVATLMGEDYSDELMEEMNASRRRSTPATCGTSTAGWSRRWTRCAARRTTAR
jgi:hypothetical protein